MKPMSSVNNMMKVDKGTLTSAVTPDNKAKPNQLGGFKEALQNVSQSKKSEIGAVKNAADNKERVLEFSSHAVERMRSRGIHFSPSQLDAIETAHAKAKDKGAKETLVITDSAALILNVKNDKVVTVMDKGNLKNNVFTKIDSTVVV